MTTAILSLLIVLMILPLKLAIIKRLILPLKNVNPTVLILIKIVYTTMNLYIDLLLTINELLLIKRIQALIDKR